MEIRRLQLKLLKFFAMIVLLQPLCRPASAEWFDRQSLHGVLRSYDQAMAKLGELSASQAACPEKEQANKAGPLAARLAASEQIPQTIGAAGRSVRRLCYGRADIADSCITVFAIGNDRFVTNEHALQWIEERRRYCRNYSREDTETCLNPGGFLTAGTTNQPKAIQPRVLRRGTYEPHKDARLIQREDLAVICLDESEKIPAIALDEAKEKSPAREGQTVYALGYPSLSPGGFGDFNQMSAPVVSTAGVISVTSGHGIVANALLLEGMSGGPLLDEQGALVGIARAGSNELQDLLDSESNIKLYRSGLLRTQEPQASGFIPRADLDDFVHRSRCKSCNASCAKPL